MGTTLSQQLKPIRDELRRGASEVRPIVQVTCQLLGTRTDAVLSARTTILEWLRDKQGIRDLPRAAWVGESFEIDASQDRPVQVEAHGAVWAMRYDNPDGEIPGRTWRTEAILAWRADVALAGIRLSVISRVWDVPIEKSVPKVVTSLVRAPGLTDYGISLYSSPLDITIPGEVEELVALLENPGRTRPVYVVSQDTAGHFLLNTERLAARTPALAHVVRLHTAAAWMLSDRIGKRRSVFGGAIRTYNPGFDAMRATFDEHPVATPEWLTRRFRTEHAFEDLLALKAIDFSVAGNNLEQSLPTFASVRRGLTDNRLRQARSGQASDQELLRLYEDENGQLRSDLAAVEDLARQMETRAAGERAEKERLSADGFRLRARIEQLEGALSTRAQSESVKFPASLEDMDEWVGSYLGDRLVLLARALRGARKAQYGDAVLVYKSLLLLGREYRDHRMGRITREQFERACQTLGVEVSRSGEESRLLQWRDEYEVEWRGEKQLLDMHVKKGSSREGRKCLRIYFFFDDDTNQVVVGHLPGHLTNEAT